MLHSERTVHPALAISRLDPVAIKPLQQSGNHVGAVYLGQDVFRAFINKRNRRYRFHRWRAYLQILAGAEESDIWPKDKMIC